MLGIVSPIDIGAYYAAADVLVLPSMCQDSFGLVVLEAFSAGLPAIAFRSGGVPELIDHPRNGLLVDQGDEAALLSSMREMMLARDARERLGAEARKTATRFSWDSTVDRLDTIYRTVLNRKEDFHLGVVQTVAAVPVWQLALWLGRGGSESRRGERIGHARCRSLDLT
jgi:glycosyltransferase involved in cell wall biosynthesis